jgi:hypothetical protein
VIGQFCAYSRGASKGAVNLAKIIRGHEDAGRCSVIRQFAGPVEAKARKPFVEMPYGQIGAFNVAGANSIGAWKSDRI